MKVTLAKIIWKKEQVHWDRMLEMIDAVSSIGGKIIAWPILVLLISAFHYAFAGMSILFETFMFFFYRGQFKMNMKNIYKKMIADGQIQPEPLIKVKKLKLT